MESDGWQIKRLGDIAEVVGGGTPSTKDPDNYGGHIPWITPKDLSLHQGRYIRCGERNITEQGFSTSSARMLPAGAVLISSRAPVGYVAVAETPVSTNQGFRSLLLQDGNVPEFFYYLLSANTAALESHASGTTFKEISGSSLKQVELLVPPLPEQRAIAHVLGSLDNKIELNRRMNETLEEMARAIFKSWFVDFDPVRAKAEGSDPGLPEHIADLFPDRFEDSELGGIPAGWEVSTLGDLSQKPQYGYTASAKSEAIGSKFLRITDINKQDWIDWASVPFCEISAEDYEKYRIRDGDILIARIADPGHGVMIEEDADAVFASYLIRFSLEDMEYNRYIQYWLKSSAYWGLVTSRSAGTTRINLNAKVLGAFPVVLPDHAVASAFRETIDSLRSRVVDNVEQSRTLAALRNTLLPKLISGELRVPDTEWTPGGHI